MEDISTDVINSELYSEQIRWVEYRPINQLPDNAPVEICVPGTGSQYMDLKCSRLYVRASIKKVMGLI